MRERSELPQRAPERVGGPDPQREGRTREERFKQAAWAYFAYGIVYWFGGLYLAVQGAGIGRGWGWFVLGALFVILFPLLLAREFSWFDRWILSRRDFCRLLTLAVAARAFGVGQVMLKPTIPTAPLPGGGEIPMSLGAAVFFLITLATGAMLARAAWAPRR